MNKLKLVSTAVLLSAICGSAFAKLPAPSPEAAEKAAAAKDKAAWNDKVSAYKLCLAQNKSAAHYYKTKNAGGKPSAETPACTDPGAYAPAQTAASTVGVADSKPVPAAGKPATPAAK